MTSMQLLSVNTAALMSSLVKPLNKRTTSLGQKQKDVEEVEEEKEEEEEKEKVNNMAEETEGAKEDAEHIHFLKQVDIS